MNPAFSHDRVSIERVLTALQKQETWYRLDAAEALCPYLTVDQVFLAIDYLTRSGQVFLRVDANQTYWLMALHPVAGEIAEACGGASMRQRMTSLGAVVLAGTVVLAMAGCAKPPTAQLNAASKAVEDARAAGAAAYAKDDFVKLEQQLALAKDDVAKQEGVLSVFRSYADADAMLSTVVKDSGQVAAKAALNIEAAKTAALTMEQEAQQVVASAKEFMGKAPTGKERAAVEVIKQDLAGLDTRLSAIHELIGKGDYLDAEVQGKAVKEKGAAVSEEIRSAIEKTKRKAPKDHT